MTDENKNFKSEVTEESGENNSEKNIKQTVIDVLQNEGKDLVEKSVTMLNKEIKDKGKVIEDLHRSHGYKNSAFWFVGGVIATIVLGYCALHRDFTKAHMELMIKKDREQVTNHNNKECGGEMHHGTYKSKRISKFNQNI